MKIQFNRTEQEVEQLRGIGIVISQSDIGSTFQNTFLKVAKEFLGNTKLDLIVQTHTAPIDRTKCEHTHAEAYFKASHPSVANVLPLYTFSDLEPAVKVKGRVVMNLTNAASTVDTDLTKKEIKYIIRHELQHALQFARGDLDVKFGSGKLAVFWKKKDASSLLEKAWKAQQRGDVSVYANLPWEKEAYIACYRCMPKKDLDVLSTHSQWRHIDELKGLDQR